MKQKILTVILVAICFKGFTQKDSINQKKERLDFAKTYFEVGGTFLPSFTGKRLIDNQVSTFQNPYSVIQYLNWGGFHFWGHAEIYVTIPLNYHSFKKNEEANSKLIHSVTTGARFLPWVYQEKKIRPYLGMSWSALDFNQKIKPDEDQPVLSKDFMLVYDAGLLYGYRNLALRAGLYYFPDNKWNYPLSKTQNEEIETPKFGFQVGLIYAMDLSKRTDKESIEKWNSYPRWSKSSYGANKVGDFFIGVGPSVSYSLFKSEYNQHKLPYLKDKLTSSNYFDMALGYHFQRLGLFTAFSFRNPRFVTEGFGTKQTIKKTSLTMEVNKFLIDYTGFMPYIGINVAYDKLSYTEQNDGTKKELTVKSIEPGITLGWDIQPGKNLEALQLRTNLRWYPFSSFKIEGKNFNFSQLEYNLIQIVFYPGRLKNKKVKI